jgi:hypothetical protein
MLGLGLGLGRTIMFSCILWCDARKGATSGNCQFWSQLWCKSIVFCIGGAEWMTLTGCKGLPQGSVLQLTRIWYGQICDIGLRFPSICWWHCGVLVTPRTLSCLCLGWNGLRNQTALVWGSKGGQEICFHCLENNVYWYFK